MSLTWFDLAPEHYEPDPADEAHELAVKACPGHLWELLLDYDEDVSLGCTRCPAGIDDLYPDGHEMICYSSEDGSIVVELGRHELPDEALPVKIPVNAWVLSSRDYWGDYDVELIIEDRDPG